MDDELCQHVWEIEPEIIEDGYIMLPASRYCIHCGIEDEDWDGYVDDGYEEPSEEDDE